MFLIELCAEQQSYIDNPRAGCLLRFQLKSTATVDCNVLKFENDL